MAVVSYNLAAQQTAFQQWLMQQGALACAGGVKPIESVPVAPSLPAGSYAQAGSSIRYSVLTTLASATVNFYGQFQTQQGQWQNVGQTVIGTSAGGIDRITLPATAGWYSNMVATVGSATVAGSEVYVLVELGRTDGGVFSPYAVLLSGYIRTDQPIDSQSGPALQNPATDGGDGGGCCIPTYFNAVFDPDSTNPYVITVTSGAAARLIFLSGNMTTSAAAGNRYLTLTLDNGVGYVWEYVVQTAQAPSTTLGYTFVLNGDTYAHPTTGNLYLPLPDNLWIQDTINVTLSVAGQTSGNTFNFWELDYQEIA